MIRNDDFNKLGNLFAMPYTSNSFKSDNSIFNHIFNALKKFKLAINIWFEISYHFSSGKICTGYSFYLDINYLLPTKLNSYEKK